MIDVSTIHYIMVFDPRGHVTLTLGLIPYSAILYNTLFDCTSHVKLTIILTFYTSTTACYTI